MANNRPRGAQRPNPQTRPGDATGAERARLQQEHAAEIAEAAKHTSMVSNPPVEMQAPGEVIDYTGDQPQSIALNDVLDDGVTHVDDNELPDHLLDVDALDDGRVEPGFIPEQLPPEQPEAAHQRPPEQPRAVVFENSASETEMLDQFMSFQEALQGFPPTPEQIAKYQQLRAQTVAQTAPIVVDRIRTMRVNTDLEDVTIGLGKNFTFQVGKLYRVTESVYEHLDSKGYVYH